MSATLEQVYASAPGSAFAVHTIEISNSGFSAPYRYCLAYEDLQAKTETGEEVTFTAAGLELSLPKRGIQGREDLSIKIDNVNGEAIAAINEAIESGEPAYLTYRAYLSSDLDAPAQRPLRLIITGAKATIRSIVLAATFRDFVNMQWPRRRYTLDFAPGLKFFG